MINLRPGTEADVAAMYRLDCLCFKEPFRFDPASMRRFAMQPGAIVVVAAEGESIAGFAILDVVHRKLFSSGYVNTIDVHPAYRRTGLATRLMAEVDRRAGEAGVNHIRLHVFAGNGAAIRLYESLGFQRTADTPGFYGEGLDGVAYVRRVRNSAPRT